MLLNKPIYTGATQKAIPFPQTNGNVIIYLRRLYHNPYKWIGFILLLAMGSCKVKAPVQMPAAVKTPTSFAGATDTASVGDVRWNDFFEDQYLVNLIDTALRSNPDLLMAVQRIEVARANVLLSRGAMLPSLSAVAAAGVDKYGDYTMNGVGNYDTNLSENIRGNRRIPNPTPDYFLGLRSSWEIDLWGKLRSRKKAAYSRFLASEKGRQLLVTSVVAQIARLYYQLLTLDEELEIIRRNIKLREIAVEMISIQKMGGRATELAVQQFKAQLLATKSLEAEKQQEIVQTENQLNLLLGRYPQPITRGSSIREQQLPQKAYTGLPSAMLRRRPDVRQAELLLTAARADIDAARAAFLPSLTITPYIGLNAFKAPLLFNPGSIAYGALAGLTAPLLNKKVLRSDYNRTVAQNLEAFYGYQKAILTAYQEVATGMRGIEALQKAYQLREQEVAVLLDAVSTANDLFVAGYASYLEVVTAQRRVLEAELELTNTRKEQFLALIDLYRALGGGWK